jgi:hypothetical protein
MAVTLDNLEVKQLPLNMAENYGCVYILLLNLLLQLHVNWKEKFGWATDLVGKCLGIAVRHS